MPYLFLLFTIVPFVELMLLMALGDVLGFAGTVALILITGMLGTALARREGLRVLRQTQEQLARGEIPEDGLLGGLLILIGAVLLVTPGVLTDLVGLSLLVPPVRHLWVRQLRRRFEGALQSGSHVRFVQFGGFGAPPRQHSAGPRGRSAAPRVVEVEGYEVVESEVTSSPSRSRLPRHSDA